MNDYDPGLYGGHLVFMDRFRMNTNDVRCDKRNPYGTYVDRDHMRMQEK